MSMMITLLSAPSLGPQEGGGGAAVGVQKRVCVCCVPSYVKLVNDQTYYSLEDSVSSNENSPFYRMAVKFLCLVGLVEIFSFTEWQIKTTK